MKKIFLHINSFLISPVLLFICIFSTQYFLFAQHPRFIYYTTDDGLSQGTIECILQDNMGFMWFGTDDGLNQFDGYTFTPYRHNPNNENSLSNNKILSLCQDQNGIIWIGTNFGLNSFDPIIGKFKRYFPSEEDTEQSYNIIIQDLYCDEQGFVWIGSKNSGLSKFDPEENELTNYKNIPGDKSSLPSNDVTSIINSMDGFLFVGTNGMGIARFDPKKEKFIHYPFTASNDSVWNEMNNRITDLCMGTRGRIWVGTDAAGVNLFDRKTGAFTSFGELSYDKSSGKISNKIKNRIRGIQESNNGYFWVATSDGLTYFNSEKNTFEDYFQADFHNSYSLNFNDLYSIYEDASGSLWVGTYGNGINVYHPSRTKFNHYKKQESKQKTFKSSIVHAINELSDGRILVGTKTGGLSILSADKSEVFNFLDDPSFKDLHQSILAIHVDKQEIIWMGTWGGGLQRLDLKNRTIKTYDKDNSPIQNNTVLAIYEEDNALWLGTFAGLVKMDKSTEMFENYNVKNGLGSNRIFCITGNHTDTLWIGAMYGGFNIFNKNSGQAEYFLNDVNDPKGISSNTVLNIFNTGGNILWLATETGINKYNKNTRTFHPYTSKNGLPNDYIYGMIPDGDKLLWISTNKGICKFSYQVPLIDENSFTNYDKADGLQGNEFNQGAFFKSQSGEIFFGGTNGLNSFVPSTIKYNTHLTPVHITSFKLFDNEVEFDTMVSFKKNIELSYKKNFISFEFVGLDFVFPSKNQYSYKLEGLDVAWSKPSMRQFASYPDLAPGHYVFKVKAANNEGLWNENYTSIGILITPPFYKTGLFIVSSILFGIFIIFLFVKIRLDRIKKEKYVLEVKVAERTQELRQKNEDIMSSIEYAKRIQEALLPGHGGFHDLFPDSFILYRPKDIVSGDFFWYTTRSKKKIFAVVDCTGHGVPGAFMSIIGDSLLRHIIMEEYLENPAEILQKLDLDVKISLKQMDEPNDTFDGMDIGLCAYHEETSELDFAGAFRPMYLLKNGELTKLDGNKFSIGGSQTEASKTFTFKRVKVQKNDQIYLFSDGYTDQFGGYEDGKSGKKFMSRNFQKLLMNISNYPMPEQGQLLANNLGLWMKGQEQVDDILVMGIRF